MKIKFDKCGHRGFGAYCHMCKPNKPMTEDRARDRYLECRYGAKEAKKWRAKGWLKGIPEIKIQEAIKESK